MCGITGIWNQLDEAAVATMARSVSHRGPDGLDWLTTDNSSLGASRLAISGDPAASAIYTDSEDEITVLFNGEIYNVTSLRAELIANGIALHTDLESEIVAKLYKLHGPTFVKLLKGMFAIAIVTKDSLVLARDRFGIKPLYYINAGDRVLFGSEIKAILANPTIKARLNIRALEEIAVFGYVSSLVDTLFEGIKQVEPGSVTSFSSEGQSTVKFWETPKAYYSKEREHIPITTAVRELRQHIIDAVSTLLYHGGHPVGIYLSGGLDSTILTLVAKALLGAQISTFTLADSPDNQDLVAAREVAKKLDTKHIERLVTTDDCIEGLGHFVEHYESLVAGGVFDIYGGLAFHLLSKTVSKYVRVAFSGEGADELFGGYYWTYTHPLGFADRIRNSLSTHTNGSHISEIVSALFPSPENKEVYRRNIFDALIRGGLANYHLQSVDRSAGAFGFEIRPPYLYDDLAEFALNLPIEYKVSDKHITKWILREAFKPELESLGLGWILNRPKEAMPSSIRKIACTVTDRLEGIIDDSTLSQHPLGKYFDSKSEMYLYDLFADIFLNGERLCPSTLHSSANILP